MTEQYEEPEVREIRIVTLPADPDQRVVVETIETSELGISKALDGASPDYLFLNSLHAMLLVDEYVKHKRLPPNPRATRFVDSQIHGFARADMIVGPAVLVGRGGHGFPTDISAEAVGAALAGQTHRDSAPAWQDYGEKADLPRLTVVRPGGADRS